VHYWDTSAVLKLYAPEADSAYFLNLIATVRQPVHCSAISCMEVLCALYRKEEAGDLKPGGGAALYRRFRRDARAGRVVLAPYGEDVAAEAERVAKAAFGERRAIMIRSLDLIHVATAVVLGATALVATDKRLRALASVLRLPLLPASH
jgi:predicted nucleic acid-binding protein